jgi:hypothetical protein
VTAQAFNVAEYRWSWRQNSMHFIILDANAMALDDAQERSIMHTQSHTEIIASLKSGPQSHSSNSLHKSQK